MENHGLRAYTASDARAVAYVINADAAKTVGFPRAVVDSVGNLWAYRFIPLSSERIVAVDKDNEVAGYAYFRSGDHHIIGETGGSVHPDRWEEGIGTALLAWGEQRATESAAKAPQGIRTMLQTICYEAERNAIQLFEDHGFRRVREWTHFVLEMNEPPVVPRLAPHLTLCEMDLENDWDLVGFGLEEAFATHWGAIPPGSYENPQEENIQDDEPGREEETLEDTSYSNAPGYCFVILDGDTVAGGVLCNAKLVERADTGRIGSIFVRPRYRRQGLGRTLLLSAFDAFWKNGFRRVILDTDSKSFSNSASLYQGVGMSPYRSEFVYEKEIRAGREVRLLGSSE
jgi:GNAT superfamily N-acetyltransferase